jgi:type IV pilus assembly protein PilC
MPVYQFQAKAIGGKTVKGEINAATDVEARVKLRAQHMIPVRVIEKVPKVAKAKGVRSAGGSVKPKDLQVFTRQFATLINSGIPVVQSIEILKNATASPSLSASLGSIKEQVEGGKRLAEAFEMYPKAFDRLYCNLLRAGEEGGVLDTILERLADYIEKAIKIKGKITGALFYPAGIMVVSILVIAVILTFVIPKFKELFESTGNELPALTQFVVALSDALVAYWYLFFGGFFGLLFGAVHFYNTPKGKEFFDKTFIQLPLFGALIQKGAIARFSRTLSTMLSCGVGILQSLEIAANTVGNHVIETTLRNARAEVAEGKSITGPLAKDKYIPDMVVQMIGVGEQTGAMDTMLTKVADFYEDEVDYAVGALTSMIEPIMMVFLGGIIAFLVIAMYLPVFNLAGAMG